MNLRRAVGVAGLALAGALGLSGCSGGDPDQVRSAVTEAVPQAEQIVVTYDLSGLARQLNVTLSIPGITEEAPELSAIIDATLKSAWTSSSIEPVNVNLWVTADPIPEEIVSGEQTAFDVTSIDLVDATESLGFGYTSGGSDVGVGSSELAKRYGEWEKP